MSGRGGKRSQDPEARARDAARRAARARLQPVWLLRAQMQFVVDALLFHLQVDVVESGHARFVEAARRAGGFGELQAAHEAFLRALLDGAFLSQASASAHACVARLLSHCDRFVALVGAHAQAGTLHALAAAGFRDLAAAFAADVRLLGALGSQRVALRGADAGSLMTRLDFNGAFAARA